jgi:hypothetical protein
MLVSGGFELPAGLHPSLAVDAICFVAEHGTARILVTLNHAIIAKSSECISEHRLRACRWSRDVLLSDCDSAPLISSAWVSSRPSAHAPEIMTLVNGAFGFVQPFAIDNQTHCVPHHAGGLDSVLTLFNPFAASPKTVRMGLVQNHSSSLMLPCRRGVHHSSHLLHGRVVNLCSTSSLSDSRHSPRFLSVQRLSTNRYRSMFENIPARRPERVATSARIVACLDRIQKVSCDWNLFRPTQ